MSTTAPWRSVPLAATLLLTLATTPLAARADDVAPTVDAALKDIEQTLGKVPSFVSQFPKAALLGAWAEVKALEFSDNTAIPPKYKALISLAVSAQIPCHYCVWEDTESAKQAGATAEEMQEAVAIAALSRHWSTIFNGMQIDFETFKKDLGGDAGTAQR
jgi:AhpD family alkylhydroperoxidase